ncbi:MAG: HD domain-containing protein, partial [Spirochaetota bacterium]
MIKEPNVQLYELIMALSQAVDLVSPSVAQHHLQVAYIAYSLGVELNLTVAEQDDLVLAGALHDIGSLSLKSRLETLDFEIKMPYKHA